MNKFSQYKHKYLYEIGRVKKLSDQFNNKKYYFNKFVKKKLKRDKS